MATEKRLIELDYVVDHLQPVLNDTTCPIHIAAEIDQIIGTAPTVDAVEVVRCKDCQKWHRNTKVNRDYGSCHRYATTKHESGYCDKGERKDND